jgi:hypothetical protein
MSLMNRSLQLSPDRVMIHTPTLTTRGGEIIQISHGRIQLQETQHQGSTIKLNLASSPINRLQHTGPHNRNTRLPHRSEQNLLLKIEC